MKTPWGYSDYRREIGPGVVFYGTPSHGGFKISNRIAERIPTPLRTRDNWYEEDCEYNIVVTYVPEYFDDGQVKRAHEALREWYPNGRIERHYHG